uniref:Secreted protein n=1 Tax=Micrurus lemniscatus lemniscatus TaxID=129467 RepID=A0A2D4J3K5_MICLE
MVPAVALSLGLPLLQLLGTVGAIDLLQVEDERFVGQGDGALLAVEAVLVPGVAFVAHHVGAFPKACNGVLATVALLSHERLVAVHAVELVFHRSEALSAQLLGASGTHKALGVVRLILVGDSSGSDGILTLHAILGKLLLVAGNTKDLISFGEETGGANHLLALAADETILVPDSLLVLHVLITCHNGLLAAFAFRSILVGGAFVTPHLVVLLQHEGLVHQRCGTLEAAETVVVPVAVLEVQLLRISPDGLPALGTGVGAKLLKALDAAVASFLLHILLPVQRGATIVAVKALGHGAHGVAAGT